MIPIQDGARCRTKEINSGSGTRGIFPVSRRGRVVGRHREIDLFGVFDLSKFHTISVYLSRRSARISLSFKSSLVRKISRYSPGV